MAAKSIKVNIGGKEYSLKGDNEQLIRAASQEVDSILGDFYTRGVDESPVNLAVLTALNIAEKFHQSEIQRNINETFVLQEVNKMSDLLSDALNHK